MKRMKSLEPVRSALVPWSMLCFLLLAAFPTAALEVDFDPETAAPGNMRFAWIHGSISARHNTDVRVQVHRYNAHSYILRQNPAVHWEAPFMYLLFGTERALLIDTGATEEAEYFPIRRTVTAGSSAPVRSRGRQTPRFCGLRSSWSRSRPSP